MKGRWVVSEYLADGMQAGIDAGINVFGAQLFAESLEKRPEEIQKAGVTVMVHDHKGNLWYITGSTTEPMIEGDLRDGE